MLPSDAFTMDSEETFVGNKLFCIPPLIVAAAAPVKDGSGADVIVMGLEIVLVVVVFRAVFVAGGGHWPFRMV